MSYPEEYTAVYDSVTEWATEPASAWTPPWEASNYFAPLYQKFWHAALDGYMYDLSVEALDPLLDDIQAFFANITSWVTTKWDSLSAGLAGIDAYIETLWINLNTSISSLATMIRDEITGLANFLSNIYAWLVWIFYEDLVAYAASLFSPLVAAWDSATTTVVYWLAAIWEVIYGLVTSSIDWVFALIAPLWDWLLAIKDAIWDALVEAADIVGAYISAKFTDLTTTLADWFGYIWEAIAAFLQEPIQWILDLFADTWAWLEAIKDAIWDSLTEAAALVGAYLGEHLGALATNIGDLMKDIFAWIWADVTATYKFVADDLIPAIGDATTGALGWLKDEFVNITGLAYNEIMDYAKSFAPMTPEKAVDAAKIMFGSAVGFGALAHGMALAVEAMPNIKYMGVHYLSAFVARMGSFGLISSATMGVIAALSIKIPFTYYMNSLLRPIIPDEKLLIEFRAKREMDFDEFKYWMGYQGYSDEWVAKIDSWLWKDPRLFEILYCADVTVPPTEWLERKFERAGYEDIDIPTLVKVVERRTTRSPRAYYTTSLRRNFRHGFLTETELEEGIEALEMAPDAIDWIKRAGILDNIYEVNQDWVTHLRLAYRNDIITEGECQASLTAIGLPEDRVDAVIALEWVRKEPRILREERKEIEDEWRALQTSYSRVYIESFRRGLISEEALATYLFVLGVDSRVAYATARHEAIKLVPKPKPDPIPSPAIPVSPVMPTYEE